VHVSIHAPVWGGDPFVATTVYEVIEDREVVLSRDAFVPSRFINGGGSCCCRTNLAEVVGSGTEPNLPLSVTRFPGPPQQNQTAVRNLRDDDSGHDGQGRGGRVGCAKLLAAKQNITGDRPCDSCQKASVFRQHRDANAAFAAEPKNERATGHLPIACETFNGMNGQA
jgi:hypothetical protein